MFTQERIQLDRAQAVYRHALREIEGRLKVALRESEAPEVQAAADALRADYAVLPEEGLATGTLMEGAEFVSLPAAEYAALVDERDALKARIATAREDAPLAPTPREDVDPA